MHIQRITTKITALSFLAILVIAGLEGCNDIKSVALEPEMNESAIPESTVDWNIYQNEKHGYTFSYPADCYFGQMPKDCKEKPPEERRSACLCFLDSTNPDRVVLQTFLGKGDKLSLAQFIVSHSDSPVFNPPQGTDLASWININFSEMFEDIPDEPNIDLNGIPAVRVYYPRSSQSPGVENIYFFYNDILFEIQLLAVDNEDNVELYDQMLSTFKLEE
jgi:hypothetical protein